MLTPSFSFYFLKYFLIGQAQAGKEGKEA
jgi:hypothetical protein